MLWKYGQTVLQETKDRQHNTLFAKPKRENFSSQRKKLRKLNELRNDLIEHTKEMKNSKTRKEMKFTLEDTKCEKIVCHKKRQ